jgi:hypothetical protein
MSLLRILCVAGAFCCAAFHGACADGSVPDVPRLLGEMYQEAKKIREDLRGLEMVEPLVVPARQQRPLVPPAPPAPPMQMEEGLGGETLDPPVQPLLREGPQRTDAPPFIPGEPIARGGQKMRVWSTSGSVGGHPAPQATIPSVIVDTRQNSPK